MAKKQKITPFLWYDHQAEEAAGFYTSVFKKSKIQEVVRHAGGVQIVRFSLMGYEINALNGGPAFRFNPSMSFTVTCKTTTEAKRIWKQLSKGGTEMMPLQKYAWSALYGWVQDRFGLTWQITVSSPGSSRPAIVPSFLFTGPQRLQAEAAIHHYCKVFGSDSSIDMISRYEAGGAGPEGSLQYAEFTVAGQTFIAMDNPMPDQKFSFNEAFSLVVSCKNQREVDYFWEELTANGGEESMCAWLKDRFGVSWQIVPTALTKALADPDPAKAQLAAANMLQMKKIVIRQLRRPLKRTKIEVKTVVKAPLEKVWKYWTSPAFIMQWNHASDDWHCPAASNDLRPGGRFNFTMAAKDGSASFDFEGEYEKIAHNRSIEYVVADGRKVKITFKGKGKRTEIVEVFEAEGIHSHDMQRAGWQAILDNFARLVEAS